MCTNAPSLSIIDQIVTNKQKIQFDLTLFNMHECTNECEMRDRVSEQSLKKKKLAGSAKLD